MTPERFHALLDTYGADLRRWPEAERTPARALAEEQPQLRLQLAQAELLDSWLDSHAVAMPDNGLMRRIAASAATVATATPLWRRRWLWPGAGLAGIGVAGSLAGAFTVSVALHATAPRATDWPERGTAFSELSADWSEE